MVGDVGSSYQVFVRLSTTIFGHCEKLSPCSQARGYAVGEAVGIPASMLPRLHGTGGESLGERFKNGATRSDIQFFGRTWIAAQVAAATKQGQAEIPLLALRAPIRCYESAESVGPYRYSNSFLASGGALRNMEIGSSGVGLCVIHWINALAAVVASSTVHTRCSRCRLADTRCGHRNKRHWHRYHASSQGEQSEACRAS